MAYFIVDNFASGLDLRRSIEVAPAGTLRVLRNAFVNEGGEIEKAKAFVKNTILTAYAQEANYKDRITGPHEVPGFPNSVFFRHRHNSLPSTNWTAGGGSFAKSAQTGAGSKLRTYWAMKSLLSLTNFGALFHAASYAQFGANGYVVEDYIESSGSTHTRDHVGVAFTNDEPTAETLVSANANRAFQMVLDGKGYVVLGDVLYASAVDDIEDMAGTGSGSLNFSQNGMPIGDGFGLGDYFGQLVIFGERGVQFYTVDASFAGNQYQRSLSAFPFAPRTIEGYGDGDLLYLSHSGIRSLRARDSSNLAMVDDVGSSIDKLVQNDTLYDANDTDRIFTLGSPLVPVADHIAATAISVVHPQTGQFWMFLKDKVYIYARHPGAKVSAWSTLTLPVPDAANLSEKNGQDKGRWAADVCRVGQTLVMRNFANEIYIYGGDNDTTYDSSETVVETPMMDMNTPGDNKYFSGIEIVSEGEWEIEYTVDPTVVGLDVDWNKAAQFSGREPVYTLAGYTQGASRLQTRLSINAQGMHIAVRLTSRSSYSAKIAQLIVFYEKGAQK